MGSFVWPFQGSLKTQGQDHVWLLMLPAGFGFALEELLQMIF